MGNIMKTGNLVSRHAKTNFRVHASARLKTKRLKSSRWIAGFALALLIGRGSALADTYTVINTSNSGAGSLQQAILDANARPGPDTIVFNIPGSGVHTIALTSSLATITDPVVIDGMRFAL